MSVPSYTFCAVTVSVRGVMVICPPMATTLLGVLSVSVLGKLCGVLTVPVRRVVPTPVPALLSVKSICCSVLPPRFQLKALLPWVSKTSLLVLLLK